MTEDEWVKLAESWFNGKNVSQAWYNSLTRFTDDGIIQIHRNHGNKWECNDEMIKEARILWKIENSPLAEALK